MDAEKLHVMLKIVLSEFARKYDTHYADVDVKSTQTLQQHKLFRSYDINEVAQTMKTITPDSNMQFRNHVMIIKPIPSFFTGLKAIRSFQKVGISALFADNCAGALRLVVADQKDMERVRRGCIKSVDDAYKQDFESRAQEFVQAKDPKYVVDNYQKYCLFVQFDDEEQAEKIFRSALPQSMDQNFATAEGIKE